MNAFSQRRDAIDEPCAASPFAPLAPWRATAYAAERAFAPHVRGGRGANKDGNIAEKIPKGG